MSLLLLIIAICSIYAKSGYLDYKEFKGKPYTVTYDSRTLFINGERSMFISGSVHYPRFGEGEWNEIFQRMREDNLNLIQLYVFWNYHEEYEGKYRWDGNANLTRFIELAGENNLFVNMRIGPYVCAEWNLGGFPSWLYLKDGCKLRTDNKIFMDAMTKFVKDVIEQTRALFMDKGGPIILAQIENELNGATQGYMNYLTTLIDQVNLEYKLDMPWVMCNGQTTNNAINACNGNDCTAYLQKHGQTGRIQIDQPAMWTENEGWFTNWGDYYPDFGGHGSQWNCRSATNLAYTVARWFARGGSYMNYYMYNGGNNMGIWSGAATTTMYADSVNFHSDMTKNEPLYSHMHKLHVVISNISEQLAYDKTQLDNGIKLPWWDGDWKTGTQQVAFVYSYNGKSYTFIESSATVYVLTKYNDKEYLMAPSSMIIVDDTTKQILYNTSDLIDNGLDRIYTDITKSPMKFRIYKEKTISDKLDKVKDIDITLTKLPVIQLKYTGGHSEYMVYEIAINLPTPNCDVVVGGHKAGSYIFYVDGKFSSDSYDIQHGSGAINLSTKLNNQVGNHRISIVNEAFGWNNGISSSMGMIADHGITSLTVCGTKYDSNDFIVRPYLEGEILKLFTDVGSQTVTWTDHTHDLDTGVVWYRSEFKTPSLSNGQYVAIDIGGMCRGHLYVNEYDLGRYWNILGRGQDTMTQRYYHVPKDWLRYDGKANSLVFVDVCNPSDPTSVAVNIVEIGKKN